MWDVNLVLPLSVFSICYIYRYKIKKKEDIEKPLNSIKPCIKTPAYSQEKNDQLQNQGARLII